MSPAQTSQRLSDEDLGALLRLVEDADSVELKLTVPHSDHATAVGALGIDPLDAQIRQVYFAPGFGVEVDAMPGGAVCSASMKSTAYADVRETLSEARPLRKLVSKEQRAFFAEYTADGIELMVRSSSSS